MKFNDQTFGNQFSVSKPITFSITWEIFFQNVPKNCECSQQARKIWASRQDMTFTCFATKTAIYWNKISPAKMKIYKTFPHPHHLAKISSSFCFINRLGLLQRVLSHQNIFLLRWLPAFTSWRVVTLSCPRWAMSRFVHHLLNNSLT